jgi:multidrug efflux pump subunit AcrA (membrane-fusion protein)
MDSLQEARLNMYQVIKTHGDDNAAVVAAIPAFRAAFDDFKAKIAEIVAADQQKSTILTGIAADKAQLKQALCRQAANIAGAIFAFAATTSNNELKQQMNVSPSKLLKTSDNQLAARCQHIHDAGIANLEALADYGINPALLTALQNAIRDYADTAPKTRTARSHRKAIGGSLRELFKEADAILVDRMDTLIGLLKESHPEFAATYQAARIIIDPSTTTTQLKGIVTNQADGAPIKGAAVTITETAQTTITDAAGEYSFKPVHSGTYTLRASATGFDDFEDDEVEVKLGVVNHLDVELVSI